MWCQLILSLLSAVVGGALVLLAQLQKHKLDTRKENQRDEGRQRLLRQLLDDPTYEWRKMTTLSRVIGASEDETARLLIGIDARGSENDDGLWGYVSKHPLPVADQ